MDCSMPGSSVVHYLRSLLNFMSIELVMLSNHLRLCCPLFLLPSIFLSISLFHRVSSFHQVAKVLELQLQHQSFQWMFRVDFLLDWLVWSPCSPRDSQESSPTPAASEQLLFYPLWRAWLSVLSVGLPAHLPTGEGTWSLKSKMVTFIFLPFFPSPIQK